VQAEPRLDTPGRRELGVEVEGAVEANRLQNFGESVHDIRRLKRAGARMRFSRRAVDGAAAR
jgi:hypothetical protein